MSNKLRVLIQLRRAASHTDDEALSISITKCADEVYASMVKDHASCSCHRFPS